MEKQTVRKVVLEKRNSLSLGDHEEKNKSILKNILSMAEYREASRVFVYVSKETEVDTWKLIEQAWKDGKNVAVPKTAAERKMYFLPVRSFAELHRSRFDVYEPTGTEEEAWTPQEGDLFLVPVVGFDRKKNRMGYGGGYYDRYFAKHKGIRKIGLAFQIQEAVFPTEETDVALEEIITENGVIV